MKIKNILEELHADSEKVTLLETKRRNARKHIGIAVEKQKQAREKLDKARSISQRKIKTFRLLDEILAEYKFSVKQKAKEAAKAAKAAAAKRKIKARTNEQLMTDVMACLDALPPEQRAVVIKSMEGEAKC